MAETNDSTTCARTNEKNINPLFESIPLIPSLASKYVLGSDIPWGSLFDDSAMLLGSALELLRGIVHEYEGNGDRNRDAEKVFGVLYLLEAAQTTLGEGHVRAHKADPIGGHPDDFDRQLDLTISFIKEGRSEAAIHFVESLKR